MLLKYVRIRNFRSIQDIKIDFNPTCRVLVGINESGKSNILNALALLSDNYDPDKKNDLREALPDENPITESFVEFIFEFEKDDTDKLFETTSTKLFTDSVNPDIVFDQKTLSLKELCSIRNEGLYVVDILEEEKKFKYWKLGDEYKLLSGWKKPSKDCPPTFLIGSNGETKKLVEYTLVDPNKTTEIPENYLVDATIQDLSILIGHNITEIVKEYIPTTIFWEYDEKNLLPNTVNISTFSSNPNSCAPLKNMFTLANIDDIKSSIDQARLGTSSNQFQNYLDRIAKKTTVHFRSVWREYKNIEFSLKSNSDQIIPGIKEKNTHDFARRSDGFKRFVTFLLMISVNVKINKLSNALLLIDEPDSGLHPSGARFLRDELIRISRKNNLLFSTHSIFMIDSEDINRHYIVKKNNEVTDIESAIDSNIAEEEVLYNALGYSLFAVLKENNIIFEGWKDKHLFTIALKNSNQKLKKKFEHIGICHAKGAKAIKTITPMIELANRNCLVISDCDQPAIEQQKIYKQDKGFGEWKTYREISSKIDAITGEDFVKNDFIVKQIRFILSDSNMPVFNQSILPDKSGKLAIISQWLVDNGMTKEQAKDTMFRIKNAIFEELKYSNIEDSYNVFLENIPV